MLFKEYVKLLDDGTGKRKVPFKKNTRKHIGAGRKEKLHFNPRLEIPIIGFNPHAKVNRVRRYKRREERLGTF